MTETSYIGACDSCGKRFRLPDSSKAFRCKACGGTVRASADDEPAAPSPPPERPAREAGSAGRAATRRGGARDGAEDGAERPRGSARRRQAETQSRTGWYILGGVMALIAVGGALHGLGLTSALTGAEDDIDEVMLSFVADWEAGDLSDMAGYHHPTERDEFEARLERIAENRGWGSGFPEIVQKMSLDLGPRSAGTRTAGMLLEWSMRGNAGEPPEGARIDWQFDDRGGRWYIFGFRITPPPLDERAEGFASAWNTGDAEALRPFLKESRAEKAIDLIERKSDQLGWVKLPALATTLVEGEDAASPFDALGGSRGAPTATHTLADGGGELVVKWLYEIDRDTWNARSFKFPD